MVKLKLMLILGHLTAPTLKLLIGAMPVYNNRS